MRIFAATLFAVVVGGAAGTVGRLLTVEILAGAGIAPWWALIAVNIVGAAALGWYVGRSRRMARTADLPSAAIATGLLGSFTTFSGFTVESAHLLESGGALASGAFVIGSIGLGLAAAIVGRIVAAQ